MSEFSVMDISLIKEKIRYLASQLYFTPKNVQLYIKSAQLTMQEANTITAYLIKNRLNFTFEPLPQELFPLINIVKQEIIKERRKPRRSKYTSRELFDTWDVPTTLPFKETHFD